MTLEEFGKKHRTLKSIYISDIKKHHLFYFTFMSCNDNNNIFLKLSFFCLTINFYFSLNTILIVDSNMSEAYYDRSKSRPGYIILNLFLPFIICLILGCPEIINALFSGMVIQIKLWSICLKYVNECLGFSFTGCSVPVKTASKALTWKIAVNVNSSAILFPLC